MTAEQELISLVQAVTPVADDPNRVAVADWFHRHPECLSASRRMQPPPELIHWFHTHYLPRHIGKKLAYQPSRGRWNAWQILSHFGSMPYGWFHHGQASVIAGHGVIVSSPHFLNERLSRDVSSFVQERFGSPVTYVRRVRDGHECNLLIIWYDLAGDPPAPRPHPVELFCQTHIEVAEGGYLEELNAHQHQVSWMSKNGYKPLDISQFSRTLHKLYPTLRRRKRRIDFAGDPSRYVFEGVQWTAAHHDWVREQEKSSTYAGSSALPIDSN